MPDMYILPQVFEQLEGASDFALCYFLDVWFRSPL